MCLMWEARSLQGVGGSGEGQETKGCAEVREMRVRTGICEQQASSSSRADC